MELAKAVYTHLSIQLECHLAKKWSAEHGHVQPEAPAFADERYIMGTRKKQKYEGYGEALSKSESPGGGVS